MSPLPVEPAGGTGPMRVVLCSFPTDEDAARISQELVERRFAACAQRFPIRSTYWWKGHVETASESLVLFKTLPKQVGALFRRLKTLHPYEVPEIVELDVARVHPGYLAYLFDAVGGGAPPYPLGGDPLSPRRSGSRRAPATLSPRGTPAQPRRR
ncbi:MAG: divalent-cation tolerance protein CutA [Thermoplasmata archaeon]|nr:divalent-cation tolerance protein CutA [Thermoplasmata archaeon]